MNGMRLTTCEYDIKVHTELENKDGGLVGHFDLP